MPRHFDLFVIGSGPGGQRAAIQAAKLGKQVGICEARECVGGVCLNTGTIPSKTFREAVLHLSGFSQRGFHNANSAPQPKVTMKDLSSRVESVIQRETRVIEDQMRRNGVELLYGSGRFLDPHTIAIRRQAEDEVKVTADFVVIAVGTTPAPIPGVEVDGRTVITSDEVLGLTDLPHTMTVVGAGVIGTEYASMFAALGVHVTLIDQRKKLLEFCDAEITESLSYQLRNMKCTFRLGEEVASVHIPEPGRAEAVLKSGKKIFSDVLLYSAGRVGATASLGLECAGLTPENRGRLKVDALTFQTVVPHIYAVGDVIGFPALASTSMEQGRLAACRAFGVPALFVPELYPYGIYAVPEISMVGRTEEQLTQEAVPYEVGISRYREIARGQILGDDSGLLKLLFHRETRRVLGVHIIGTSATELVHIGQAVIAFGGTIDYFVNSVFNYPTFAECYKVAALDGYNKVGPPPLESAIDWNAFDSTRGT